MKESSFLQPPKLQLYYRVLATLTTWTDLGNQTWWGYDPPSRKIIFTVNRFLMRICAPICFTSQLLYFYLYYDELSSNAKGVMIAMIPVAGLVNSVILLSVRQGSYKKIMKNLMKKIHLHNFLGNDEFVKTTIIKAEKNIRWASYFMIFFLMLDALAWCVLTGINSIQNRHLVKNKTMRFETTLYITVPINYEYDFSTWVTVHIVNTYLVWCGSVILLVHNCTNYVFVFQVIGHIEILNHKLKTQFSGNLTQEQIKERLIDVINYHSFVLKIFRDVQSAFGFNVSAFYFYNLLVDSLLLYMVMIGNERSHMTFGLMLFVYVGGLIVVSFVLEEIRKQSDHLSILVYNLEWEEMSVSNRKMLLLLLMRVQPPMIFKAAGGLNAGVYPMISILKSTFSYYVVLKSSMPTT